MTALSRILVLSALALPVLPAAAQNPVRATATPIEHFIVVIGENLSFDNLFATYQPPPGQSVANLLSRGIVNPDGRPGPNAALAAQRQAVVRERYQVMPTITGTFGALPQPSTT